MMQECIRHAREALFRFGIVGDDRFAADIARCCDQRAAEFRQQKMMQWAVRQEDSQLGEAGRHSLTESTILAPARQDDRARNVDATARFRIAQVHTLSHGIEAVSAGLREHDRERLVRPPLACAQPHNRCVVRRIAHQMVTADALDRDDAAATQTRDRRPQRLFAFIEFAIATEYELWSTSGAGERLGMKAPIKRVVVLRPALRAEFEGRPWTYSAGHREAPR